MAFTTLSVVAPHATAYDEDYPTRSTENYSHALHEVLQDMEDATNWYLSDQVPATAVRNSIIQKIHDMVEAVFDYAEDAIEGWRATQTPGLSKPTWESIDAPLINVYSKFALIEYQVWSDCIKKMYMIYYMWETEEDPLLFKEKLQELLIAWPLLDTTIELNSELGQEFKVYPSWKNADLG